MVQDLSSFQAIEMAIFNTATLTDSFSPMNGPSSYVIYTGSGFPNDIKVLKFWNGSTTNIIMSYDGITNEDIMPAGATQILDLQANHANNSAYGSGTLNGRAGQIIWGSGTPGTGNFYIVGYR